MNGLEQDFGGEFGDDGDGLSGMADSALSDASSAATNLGSTATSAVGDAVGAVGGGTAGAIASGVAGSAVAQGTGAAQAALANSGVGSAVTSILSTVDGAMTAAGGIESSLQQGDYLSAGSQALQIVQQAALANSSTEAVGKAGLLLAAKFSAAGATIGTVIPVIGNVVGAVIGAIVGFVVGVSYAVMGNVPKGIAVVYTALNLQIVYEGFRRSSQWFSRTAGKNDSYMSLPPPGIWGPGLNSQTKLDEPLKIKDSLVSRDAFFKTWADTYRTLQGSGETSSFSLFSSSNKIDFQPALDMMMIGGWPSPNQVFDDSMLRSGSRLDCGFNRPCMGMDYALWLAKQPDGGMSIMKSAPPELQATILPMMPIAVAARLYRSYVQVLAAPACYSPSAIDAVRKAAMSQGQKAGDQVSQCLALSLPNDDLGMLMHAYAFLNVPILEHPPMSTLTSGQKLNPGDTLYSPSGQYRLTLQHDGNLVLYGSKDDSNATWSTGVHPQGVSFLILQSDGNLVLYAPDGKTAIWSPNTAGNKGDILTLQDDGNLVLYDTIAGKHAIWNTGTVAYFSTYPILSYMVERKGIWSDTNGKSPTLDGLRKAIAQCVFSRMKGDIKVATAMLFKANSDAFLEISVSQLNALATQAKGEKWSGDPFKGESTAQLDNQIGLTSKLGGAGGKPGLIHRTPVRNKPVAAKPKTNLTNKHWWIEAIVAALIGIGVYKVVHPSHRAQ